MARRRLVLCPWALALITGIHQAVRDSKYATFGGLENSHS